MLSRAVLGIKSRLEAGAEHDDLYDRVYFERQNIAMRKSAQGIAASIIERLPTVRHAVDVGCGSGSIIEALRERGISSIGLEYAEAALDLCRSKGLDVRKFDIESEEKVALSADLVLSTEVAEHIPEEHADAYVDLLTGLADTILMTAAVPGQGGTDHVNEQPNEYWIEKFMCRGFSHDMAVSQSWREDWRRRGVDKHRASNVMLFLRHA